MSGIGWKRTKRGKNLGFDGTEACEAAERTAEAVPCSFGTYEPLSDAGQFGDAAAADPFGDVDVPLAIEAGVVGMDEL